MVKRVTVIPDSADPVENFHRLQGDILALFDSDIVNGTLVSTETSTSMVLKHGLGRKVQGVIKVYSDRDFTFYVTENRQGTLNITATVVSGTPALADGTATFWVF